MPCVCLSVEEGVGRGLCKVSCVSNLVLYVVTDAGFFFVCVYGCMCVYCATCHQRFIFLALNKKELFGVGGGPGGGR